MTDRHKAVDEWLERVTVSHHGPMEMTLYSTNRCNLKCFMCWHGMVDDIPVTVKPGQLDPYLEKADRVLFSGGEPLWLTKNVNQAGRAILDRIMDKHPHIKLNTLTNGIMLKGDIAKMVLEKFESVCFSIETLDPAVYEKVRGLPLLEAALENMENFGKMKKEAGLKRHDKPLISMNSITINSTISGIPAMTRKLWEIGGFSHSIAKLMSITASEFEQYLTVEYLNREKTLEAQQMIEKQSAMVKEEKIRKNNFSGETLLKVKGELEEIQSETGIEIEDKSHLFMDWEVPHAGSGTSVCQHPWTMACVHNDGSVYCCTTNSFKLGNLHTDTFEEVWNGEAARSLRSAFIRGDMKGCNPDGCHSPRDHFKVASSFREKLSANLRTFISDEQPESILFLRSGPVAFANHASNSLSKLFPDAELHVVVSEKGDNEDLEWGENAIVHPYPGERFDLPVFTDWWRGKGGADRYSLVVMLYGEEGDERFRNVEDIAMSFDADRRLGIRPDCTVVDVVKRSLSTA
jgi:MoaA/NifB/PqqE/SkfB family radical SAM enzyme